MLPKELILIEEDLEGPYSNNTDCWIPRALKRTGITVNEEDGYAVYSIGEIIHWSLEETTGVSSDRFVGIYKWEDGTPFSSATKRTGKLVFHAV